MLLLIPIATASFVDVTTTAGLDGLYNSNAAWGDYDADGWPDLFVAGQLWHNVDGRFELVSGPFTGTGVFGDVDNDGDLDLYTFGTTAHLFINDPGAESGWREVEGAFPESGIVSSRGAAFGDLDGDALLDVYVGAYEGNGYEPDAIYHNEGGETFSLAWREVPHGVYSAYTKPGRGVTLCDFDEDADLDIYVSNYRLEPNALWRSGDTGLTESALELEAAGTDDGWDYSFGHTIGSSWGDLDNDGHFDLFVGNFSHSDAHQDRPQFLRNGGPWVSWVFVDRSARAELAWQESFASPTLGDYDNDGDLDLYFTTVYEGDYPVLYRNDGEWFFTDVTDVEGLAGLAATYQAAWADYDRDGDLDLVSAGKLLSNEGADGHWVAIRVVGDGAFSDSGAIGAQVRIEVGSAVLTRQVEAGTGEFNQNDLTLHFGLGDEAGPLDLEVRWPHGLVQRVTGVAVDGTVEVSPCVDADADLVCDDAAGGDTGDTGGDTAGDTDLGDTAGPDRAAPVAAAPEGCGCGTQGPGGALAGILAVAAALGARSSGGSGPVSYRLFRRSWSPRRRPRFPSRRG